MGRTSFPVQLRVLVLVALCLLVGPAHAFAAAPVDQISYSFERPECPEDEDGWYDVAIVNTDGTATHELTLNGVNKDQSWAPDGSRMVALQWDKHPVLFHPRQLLTLRADGSDAHMLTTWPRSITDVQWSPVSSRVMAVADHDPNRKEGRIMRYDVKTGARSVMYQNSDGAIIHDMAWSPDGTKMLFIRRFNGVDQARMLDLVTGKVTITKVGTASTRAIAWSVATGEQAFATEDNIKILTPAGSLSTLVSLGRAGGLGWSPTGDALTFDGIYGDTSGVYTISRDGKQIRQLRQDNRTGYGQRDTGFDPTWRPKITRTSPRFDVTFPTSCDYYGPEQITYTLLGEDEKPLAGRTITLQSSSDGRAWRTMAIRTTDANGQVPTWARPTKLRYYRAFYDGDGVTAQTTSRIGAIKPRVDVSVPKMSSKVAKGAYFKVSGTLRPYHKPGSTRTSPVRIYFYRWETNDSGQQKWVLRRIATAACKKSKTGMSYSTKVSLPFKGQWAARAYHPEDDVHSATTSAERRLTVR